MCHFLLVGWEPMCQYSDLFLLGLFGDRSLWRRPKTNLEAQAVHLCAGSLFFWEVPPSVLIEPNKTVTLESNSCFWVIHRGTKVGVAPITVALIFPGVSFLTFSDLSTLIVDLQGSLQP